MAKEVELEDKFENMGAQMVKEVASKTSDVAGDGTTTATVLAQSIYKTGSKLVAAGHSPMDLKRGIDKAVDAVVGQLKGLSREIANSDEIAQVGTISANGDEEIGRKIAEAMDRVGKEGVITIEENKGLETTMETVEGDAVRSGLPVPVHGDRPGSDGGRARQPVHPDPREEDQLDAGHAQAAGEDRRGGPADPGPR